jgi:hypothetical protein
MPTKIKKALSNDSIAIATIDTNGKTVGGQVLTKAQLQRLLDNGTASVADIQDSIAKIDAFVE